MRKPVSDRADALPAIAEVFRQHGYEGASLSLIGAATGLGKGSLYNFFPGGKAEMAEAVLAEIEAWFEQQVFAPLRDGGDLAAMFAAVDAYFRSGRRVCLVGALALADSRDRFAERVRRYFADWVEALAQALVSRSRDPAAAREAAEDIVAGVQGGLVLARALDEPAAFGRALARLQARVA